MSAAVSAAPIVIPAPGADVLRVAAREMHDADTAARLAAETAALTRHRASAIEAALRAALAVPAEATLDLAAGVFRPPG